MTRYRSQKDGDFIVPQMTGYRMACCDCGLVHTLDFQVMVAKPTTGDRFTLTKPRNRDRLQVTFKAYRNKRATAAMRRKTHTPSEAK